MTARDPARGASTIYRWFEGFGPQPEASFPFNDAITAPLCFPALLTQSECTSILELARTHDVQRSSLGNPTEGYRVASSRWIWHEPSWHWVFEKLEQVFRKANASYAFDIRGFADPLLVVTYADGGRFEWHVDTVTEMTSTRKLSLSVQLSDRSDYEGGALEFAAIGELPLSRALGTVVCFPSFLAHRVAPVTSGTRHALIAWAHGPAFR